MPWVDQRLSQPRARAPLPDVLRRDPGFRQPFLGKQRAQPARVLAIGLRAPLAPAQRARLDRLGEMRDRTGTLKRLGDEQPAGARLERDLHLAILEACGPALHRAGRRVDPPARQLAGVGVQSVDCDLPAVHVKASYDRHLGASFEFRHCHFARVSRAEPREALFMPSSSGVSERVASRRSYEARRLGARTDRYAAGLRITTGISRSVRR